MMVKRCFIWVLLALCAPLPLARTQARGARLPAIKEEPVDTPPVLTVPSGYKYEPHGRRDPFVNPVPKPKAPEPEIPVVRPPGLRGVLITEIALVGIVSSKEPGMNKAVVKAPGNKIYFVAGGDELFDAVVKEIRPDAVVFTQTPRGQSRTPVRDVVRTLAPAPGEKK